MPGGEAAIREPWRMACAWLADAFDEARPPPAALAPLVDDRRWGASPGSRDTGALAGHSSIGRLFDAVAAHLRVARGRALRGPGGDRAGGAAASAARPAPTSSSCSRRRRRRHRSAPGAAGDRPRPRPRPSVGRGRGALSRRPRRRDRLGLRRGRGAARDRLRDAERRRLREPPARPAIAAELERAGWRCSCRSGCRRGTAASPTARRRSRPPAPSCGTAPGVHARPRDPGSAEWPFAGPRIAGRCAVRSTPGRGEHPAFGAP